MFCFPCSNGQERLEERLVTHEISTPHLTLHDFFSSGEEIFEGKKARMGKGKHRKKKKKGCKKRKKKHKNLKGEREDERPVKAKSQTVKPG